MSDRELSQLFHDLRAPLARAQTYSKILSEAQPEEVPELLEPLRKALADLDQLIRQAEEKLS